MSTNTTNNRKYLDLSGLGKYNEFIKSWAETEIETACIQLDDDIKRYYINNPVGSVGVANKALQLYSPVEIKLTCDGGGVTGTGTFNGKDTTTIFTTLHLDPEVTYDIKISGNAGSADKFSTAMPIRLTGPVTGYVAGGTTVDGWTIDTSITDGSVTNAKLAGSISNDKLLNNSITLGTTVVNLGESKTELSGFSSITSTKFIGSLEGNALTATKATGDGDGNNIISTYATKAELAQAQSAIRFKGTVATLADLPSNPQNGDIYNVESEGKSYIWSSQDNAWSVFGSSYGPATATTYGLVKIGQNITNTVGSISITQNNVDNALGYQSLKGITINHSTDPLVAYDRIVNIDIPTDYATQEDIDASFTFGNVTTALGYEPLKDVLVNNVPLVKTDHQVNIDLTPYATQTWTTEQIKQKLTSLYKFKGSLQNYGELLKIKGQVTGDVYNIIEGNDPATQHPEWPAFAGGTNFAWDGAEWDSLGGTLDLSAYYKKTEVDALLIQKSNIGHIHDDRYYTETEVNTLLNQKSNINHNHDERYYTEAEVDSIIANLTTTLKSWVNTKIAESFQTATESGVIDDVRTYSTYDNFPGNPGNPTEKPVTDVQYVAADTKVEYQWNGTAYEAVNDIASDEEIGDLFK